MRQGSSMLERVECCAHRGRWECRGAPLPRQWDRLDPADLLRARRRPAASWIAACRPLEIAAMLSCGKTGGLLSWAHGGGAVSVRSRKRCERHHRPLRNDGVRWDHHCPCICGQLHLCCRLQRLRLQVPHGCIAGDVRGRRRQCQCHCCRRGRRWEHQLRCQPPRHRLAICVEHRNGLRAPICSGASHVPLHLQLMLLMVLLFLLLLLRLLLVLLDSLRHLLCTALAGETGGPAVQAGHSPH